MSINTQTNQMLALFATIAVLWGTSFTTIEVGLDALPPVLFAAPRYDVAGVVLFGYGLPATEGWRPRGRDKWLVVFVGDAFLTGAHFSLLFSGQWYMTNDVLAVVISLAPVFTPLFAWPILPEGRLDALGLLGVLPELAGMVIIALTSRPVNGQLFGVLLLFLAATTWTFSLVLIKRPPDSPSVIPMRSWMMLISVATLHVTSPVLGEPGLAGMTWTLVVVVALLFLAMLCSAVGFVVCFVLLDRIGVVEINLVNYATLVVATVTGWASFGERPGPITVAGFVLVLAGFVFMKRDVLSPFGRRFGVCVGLVAPAPAADPDGLLADD